MSIFLLHIKGFETDTWLSVRVIGVADAPRALFYFAAKNQWLNHGRQTHTAVNGLVLYCCISALAVNVCEPVEVCHLPVGV